MKRFNMLVEESEFFLDHNKFEVLFFVYHGLVVKPTNNNSVSFEGIQNFLQEKEENKEILDFFQLPRSKKLLYKVIKTFEFGFIYLGTPQKHIYTEDFEVQQILKHSLKKGRYIRKLMNF